MDKIHARARPERRGRSPHARCTGPMLASPRCGARTRCGHPCRSPAVRGRCRCRMHGGARGSGAPYGNRNAFKHGLYTRAALAQRRAVNRLLRHGARQLAKMEKDLRAGRRSRCRAAPAPGASHPGASHRGGTRRHGRKPPTGPP